MTEAPPLVLAVSNWATNGYLMADLVKLGLLDLDVPTLDTTYEKGVWWSEVQPRELTTHHRPTDGSDFRNLPYRSGSWRQIAFDPPYCAMGGQETSDIGDFNTRYGRHTVETPADVQLLINEGATELWRLLAELGLAYIKVADYVFSGELWLGVHWTLEHLVSLGFMVEDMFTLTRDVASPQPKRSTCIRCGEKIQRRKDHETWTDLKRSVEPSAFCRRPHPFLPHRPDPTDNGQDHASYNASVLIVVRKPRRGRRTAQYPQPIDPQLELFG